MPSRKSDTSALTRPVTWVRDLLQRPVKMELRGAQVHVVLGERADRAETVSKGPSAGESLRRGHGELHALLRRHPETRDLMRHLAYTEAEIGRFGSRAIKREIPVPVLAKALEQFDRLVEGVPTEGLSYLRARLAEAIETRGRALQVDEDTETRPGSLEVMEASHSLFDEMERSWTGQIPLEDGKVPGRG